MKCFIRKFQLPKGKICLFSPVFPFFDAHFKQKCVFFLCPPAKKGLFGVPGQILQGMYCPFGNGHIVGEAKKTLL